MKITPNEFLQSLIEGKNEKDLNKTESLFIDEIEFKKLISKKYGLTRTEAKEHLETDYTNGFTICGTCGSYYELGNGFTKHLSNGCLHCEGEEKHNVYWHKGNNEKYYKSQPRYMSQMFDDGMHYCKDKLQIERFKNEVVNLKSIPQ